MIRVRDVNIVSKAFTIAEKNKISFGYTMVSVLAQGKNILSVGINDYVKTHAKQPQIRDNNTIPTHAEVKCVARYIVKGRRIPKNSTLYVVGLTKAKISRCCISSKPCDSCMQFINTHKINRVVYVTNNGIDFSIHELFPEN